MWKKTKYLIQYAQHVSGITFIEYTHTQKTYWHILIGAVVVVWVLDLQLPMQSVSITTKVVSSNPDQGEVYNIMWWSLSVTCDRSVVFSGSSVFLH
jgi:hypothetical protein